MGNRPDILLVIGSDSGFLGLSKQVITSGYQSYSSIRSLPEGLLQRKPLYVILDTVYYFESLYVQNQHSPEETAERAEWLRRRVIETVDELT